MLPNVIIAGAPKSGTTSLHEWLTAHPDVAGPEVKETGYFVDKNSHAFNPAANFCNQGIAGYETLFDASVHAASTVIEVAPDYMCQQTALQHVPSLSTRPTIVFVLREPAAQIYSLFNYLKHNWQYVPADMSFVQFVELARQRSPALGHHELLQNALGNACYIDLIERWIERAGRERIRIYLFEDLVADSPGFMRRLCKDLDIDPGFYDRYTFAQANEGYRVRSSVLQASNVAIRKRIPKGRFYNAARAFYRKLNTSGKPARQSPQDQELLHKLRLEFSDANRRLGERFDIDLGAWQRPTP